MIDFEKKNDYHILIKNGDSLETFVLELTGSIDHPHYFKQVSFPGSVKNLTIDLKGITTINSVGIASWIQWITPLAKNPDINIKIAHLPACMVLQANMIEGFIPQNIEVESLAMHYYCESCDESYIQYITVGKDLIITENAYQENFKHGKECSQGGPCELEPEHQLPQYYSFLVHRK